MNAIERNLVLLRLHGFHLHTEPRGKRNLYFFVRTPNGERYDPKDYDIWEFTGNKHKKTAIHQALKLIC